MIAKTFTVTAGMLAAALLNACTAHAEPPKFPDISGYAPVNAQDYQIAFDNPGRQPTRTDYFLSPDGVICVVEGGGAACFGNNLPTVPPLADQETQVSYMDTQKGLYQSANPGYVVNNSIHGQAVKTLPPFHSIAVGGTICGVDDAGTTACKDSQGRGFVLSPKGSGWLPKV